MAAPTKRSVVSRPTFIDAYVLEYPPSADDLFEVRASTLVEDDDKFYRPVLDYLATHCTCELHRELVEDPKWFQGEFIHAEHQVYKKCPGDSVHHSCCHLGAVSMN